MGFFAGGNIIMQLFFFFLVNFITAAKYINFLSNAPKVQYITFISSVHKYDCIKLVPRNAPDFIIVILIRNPRYLIL